MDFLNINRIKKYKDFYKIGDIMYNEKKSDKSFKRNTFLNCFNIKEIAHGKEGVVYYGTYKYPHLNYNTIIKYINLDILNKGVNINILNQKPSFVYDIFYNLSKNIIDVDDSINNGYPSLIELISYTLTNQLIFQDISPHFNVNYYWEYTSNQINNNVLLFYNEYINNGTLFEWGKTKRSNKEWINILMQICLGIITLQKYYGMIHGDFHSANILIQKIKPGGAWKYIHGHDEYIIPNLGWVVIFNDFGFCTIPDKLEIKWFCTQYIYQFDDNLLQLYDIITLFSDLNKQSILELNHILNPLIQYLNFKQLISIKLPSRNKITYNKSYTMTDILKKLYKEYTYVSHNIYTDFICTYNMNKTLDSSLLPEKFKSYLL